MILINNSHRGGIKVLNYRWGWHKKGWHKVLKKWGGIKEGGIRFLGGGIKRGWHKILKKNGGWHKKGGVKKKPMKASHLFPGDKKHIQ